VLPLRFGAYDEEGPNVIVDGAANAGTVLTLSHWPGSPTPPELRDDLSAQIALRALERPALFEGVDIASNNHFDQDGLASAYTLVDPDAALARRDVVVDVARAGDFGTFASRDSARIAIAVAAYEDPRSSPLDSGILTGPYPDVTASLYRALLPRFTEMLDHPDRFRDLWEHEDEHLGKSIAAVARGLVRIDEHRAADLAVVTVPEEMAPRPTHRFTQEWTEAVHPMAVNNATERLRILLVHGHRYRLELRYESWVMFVSHPVAPRPDLRPLADELTALEPRHVRWEADPPGALTPQLRIAGDDESDLKPEFVTTHVVEFLDRAPSAGDPFVVR
jgi:hypothetical protein